MTTPRWRIQSVYTSGMGKNLGLEPKGIPPRVAEEEALGSSSITGWEFSIPLPTRRQS